MSTDLPAIVELTRRPSPVATPQALTYHEGTLWVGSRDARRLCAVDPQTWRTLAEVNTPGIPWDAVPVHDALYCTIGEDPDDDRYLHRYVPGKGFDGSYRVAQPEFTGSYLSFDGQTLYLSQWYKHRLIEIDRETGGVGRIVPVGAEICGHVFAEGHLYVLRGTEQDGESWQVARLDPLGLAPAEDLARVPFACRSLAFDGERFWTNHRAANETVSFSLPGVSA